MQPKKPPVSGTAPADAAEEEDEWDARIRRSGCYAEHVALQDCYWDHHDWRRCTAEMAAFRRCFERQRDSGAFSNND